MEFLQNYLDQLHAQIAATPAIRAAWLSGSFGRGAADRFSDIDLHVLVENIGEFRAGAKAWLDRLQPLVLYKLLFDDRMINALTSEGLRLDLWLYDQTPARLDVAKNKPFYDPASVLNFGEVTAEIATVDPAALRAQIEEFWRCISLTPTVIGRNELIVAFQGLNIELAIVLDLLLRGYGIQRDTGVKTLNRFLPAAQLAELMQALALDGLTAASLVKAHLALAQIVQRHGRVLSQRHGFSYPLALEEAVLRYVERWKL